MSRELERMRKKSAESIKNAQDTAREVYVKVESPLEQVQSESCRVSNVSRQAPAIIEGIDKKFKEKTRLSDADVAFLLLCTALQCARQYFLSNDSFRISARQGDVMVEKLVAPLPPAWQDVLTQSVPYDAIKTGIHASDTGLAGTTHRYRTLGHDPVLGWIFGTANIMTNSLTKTDLESYQVHQMTIIRHYPLGAKGILDNTINYAQSDPMLLAAAVARQAIHFGSDYFTKQGLPIPVVATVNNDLAKDLITKAHIDMWSITRGAMVAALINQLIATMHRMFYQETLDGSEKLYEVRTRRILSYSNALAASSNVIFTAVTKDFTKLDVGGLSVALYRFISDGAFIQSIKRDFLREEIYQMVVGKPYDFIGGK